MSSSSLSNTISGSFTSTQDVVTPLSSPVQRSVSPKTLTSIVSTALPSIPPQPPASLDPTGNCVICIESLKEFNEKTVVLITHKCTAGDQNRAPILQGFHIPCAQRWFAVHPEGQTKCPCCNQPMTPETAETVTLDEQHRTIVNEGVPLPASNVQSIQEQRAYIQTILPSFIPGIQVQPLQEFRFWEPRTWLFPFADNIPSHARILRRILWPI